MPATVPDALSPARFVELGRPELTAGELVLRPFTPADADVLVAAYCDETLAYWHGRTMTAAEAADTVAADPARWTAGTGANWLVTDRGEPTARIGLNHLDLFGGQAEIAYWTLPAARGRGIMPRALGLLVPWLFGELGLHRLVLTHSVRNEASCRVACKAGFALEGTMRSQLRHVDGWHDAHLHARLASDAVGS